MSADCLTPMVKQYLRIKEIYNDAILLYRVGDFYEMFFEDAEIASKLLDITLTSRDKDAQNPVPLCGVPYHSVEPYIAKLISLGKKVAICDQVEDPKLAKGVVKREVTRVITPGVVLDGEGIAAGSNNYVAAISKGDGLGLALADASTGRFLAEQFESVELLAEEIIRLEPREILLAPASMKDQNLVSKITRPGYEPLFTAVEERSFESNAIAKLDGAAHIIRSLPEASRAAGAVWFYIKETQKSEPRHITRIEASMVQKTLRLDETTKRNLELFRTMIDGSEKGTLIGLLDRTSTAMGSRKLRNWMLYPLTDCKAIDSRLDAVGSVLKSNLINELPGHLSKINDMERIGARIAMGTASARDLAGLKNSIAAIANIPPLCKGRLGGVDLPSLSLPYKGREEIDSLTDIAAKIEKTIVDDPPFSMRDGGIIRDGVDKELDELRSISSGGKDSIAAIEARERERTGINSLKVKYNRVFGYYIEITNTHKDKVPADYIRKQTLVNAERYITPELKDYEDKVLASEDKIRALEYDIFCRLREEIAAEIGKILRTADAIATIDVLTSFAIAAADFRYTRPAVNDGAVIKIVEGRHPIIERTNPTERFVPNDTLLDDRENNILIITGPNMAGKSTVMRQTALIVIMAQMGSYVPAREATIGTVDRIFTRIGASDALSLGQSTFMVEMKEAATILKEATRKSLIVIDEIGRGTSTFDGLSIAWAIAEDLHDRVKARTLFATHYHELTELALTKERIKNFNIAVKEWNGEVIFLRKLIPGGTSRSYGIQVARLAGLPESVISRSHEVLKNLEEGELDEIGKPRLASHGSATPVNTTQLNLFLHELKQKI